MSPGLTDSESESQTEHLDFTGTVTSPAGNSSGMPRLLLLLLSDSLPSPAGCKCSGQYVCRSRAGPADSCFRAQPLGQQDTARLSESGHSGPGRPGPGPLDSVRRAGLRLFVRVGPAES